MRAHILEDLARYLRLPAALDLPRRAADALDAIVRVLAGQDFLNGECVPPDDLRLAKKEGWTWIRRPDT